MTCPICETYELAVKAGEKVAPGPVTFVCPYDGFEVVRIFDPVPSWPQKP